MEKYFKKIPKDPTESPAPLMSASQISSHHGFTSSPLPPAPPTATANALSSSSTSSNSDSSTRSTSRSSSSDGGAHYAKKKAKQTRVSRAEWLVFFPWLEFKDSKPFCKFCNQFITKKIYNLKRHQEGKTHKINFQKNVNKTNLEASFNKSATVEMQNVSSIAVLKCLALISEHNLPLSLMDHLPDFLLNVCPDSKIASKFKCGRTKASNVLKNAVEPFCFKEIALKLRNNKFSLIVDESTDVSMTKCIAIVVRFYDDANKKIVDKFLCILDIKDSSAESIFATIKEYLDKMNVPYENLIGFGSDGANVMQGEKNGVQAKLKTLNSFIYSLVCSSHSMHKCAEYAITKIPNEVCSIPQEIYNFLKHSPKRQDELKIFQEYFNLKQTKIKKVVATRWLSFYEVIQYFLKNWEALKLYFVSVVLDDKNLKGNKHLDNLNNPLYRVYFNFLNYILKIITDLNKSFQSEIPKIHLIVNEVTKKYNIILKNFVKAEYLESLDNIYEVEFEHFYLKPLNEIYFGYGFEELFENLTQVDKDDFLKCIQSYYIEICQQLKKRLNITDNLLTAFEVIDPNYLKKNSNNFRLISAHLTTLLVKFPNLLTCSKELMAEELQNSLEELDKKDNDIDAVKWWVQLKETKNSIGEYMFKNISSFAIHLLSLPHSSASAERVFSSLNNIKTDNRNRLGYEMIHSLMSFKDFLKSNSFTCGNFNPSKSLVKKMNN